jgi:N-formylglutamate amidohydrolase
MTSMPVHEEASIVSELNPPFTVVAPAVQTAPFVLCSPHSGRVYTRHFLAQSRLDPMTLRKSEDCFVDELFSGVAELGVPLIASRFPRAYLDVNREPYELDPELFHDTLPDFANTQSVRVIGGLGTIARIVADGEEIYRGRLSVAQALERIERLYMPFHAALASLLESTRRQFGYAILIDCHSMPSALMAQSGGPRPDFVIGDRFGASCDARLTRHLKEILVGLGYDAQLNRPYAGGYITEHYGRPHRGIHAVQLEINRGLYLDEAALEPSPGFIVVRSRLTALASRLFAELPAVFERRAAAE